MEKNNKSFKVIIVNLIKIVLLFFFTYVIMVFISHFSVYNSSETYKIKESFDAMLFKTDVPAQFFIYFGIFIILTVFIALFINLFKKKTK